MKHAYYISDDLDELETVHDELVVSGLQDQRIHVLSDEDAAVEFHHMRPMNPFFKTNVVRALFAGAVIGIGIATVIMAIPYVFGFESTAATIPFTLGALFIVGFSTWEGGFLGMQAVNQKFKDVFKRIHEGQHLMIVDYNIEEENRIRALSRSHPGLQTLSL